jgi:3-hydroxybutyryl-CoA dehydrogenase
MNDAGVAASVPESVVILGAGTMGAGMAVTFAGAGSRVWLVARHERTLERARTAMSESLRRLEGTGPARDGEDTVLARVRSAGNLDDVDFDVDLVVESIPEVLDDKRALLRRVEDLTTEASIVVSNTSSLPLPALAEGMRRPHRFAGYHWFNPPELVELVEVVPAPATAPEVIGTLVDWSTGIGKRPVAITREIEGFVANRLQYALIREAYALVEGGVCSMEDVDAVVRTGLGPRWAGVGPFETLDLAGLDVHRAVARSLFPTLSNAAEPPAMLEAALDRGALGVKSGEGILGGYDAGSIEALARRRARVLLAMSRLHADDR